MSDEGAVRRPERFVVLIYDERRSAVGFVCGIVGETLQPPLISGYQRKAPERRTTHRVEWPTEKKRELPLWRGIDIAPVEPYSDPKVQSCGYQGGADDCCFAHGEDVGAEG